MSSRGREPAAATWLTIAGGQVAGADFAAYARAATRMKVTPAFDSLDLTSPENDLFGDAATRARHFTVFARSRAGGSAPLAEAAAVRMMNAMAYVGAPQATTARHWRIRHGAVDRDTSLAIPVMLARRLENAGRAVDMALPWGQGHGGDYDLPELFEWFRKAVR